MDTKQRIKSILKQRNMSIYNLSEAADLSSACINNWYSKRAYEPSLSALRKISIALDIPLSQLVNEDSDTIVIDPTLRELYKYWVILTHEQQQALVEMVKSMVVDKDV